MNKTIEFIKQNYLLLTHILATIIIVAMALLMMPNTAGAAAVDKLTVCHHTDSNTNPWVEQSINANELQSHLDNGDFLVTEGTPCPPVTPTLSPTPALDCDGDTDGDTPNEDDDCGTPTVTPTVTLVDDPSGTPTVTPGPQSGGGSSGSDGRNDGLGCASHDCSRHTDVPLAPNTGRGE